MTRNEAGWTRQATVRALALVLAAATVPFAFSGSAEAHTCTWYGGADEHGGCDAHNCPNDGMAHDHWHDCAWYAWCFNHGCTSGT